jgi:hypothetical protein
LDFPDILRDGIKHKKQCTGGGCIAACSSICYAEIGVSKSKLQLALYLKKIKLHCDDYRSRR